MEQMNTPPAAPEQNRIFGGRELLFGAVLLPLAWLYVNAVLYGGYNLGFSVFAILCTAWAVVYLLRRGCRLTLYSASLLILCAVIAAGFARSDDGFVKLILRLFLFVGTNLALALLAGQNLRDPGKASSLLDAPAVFFRMGFGRMTDVTFSLKAYLRGSGRVGKNALSVLLGLGIAVPVLLTVIPLLMRADAAFEGLLQKLPSLDGGEILGTLIIGTAVCWILFSRGTALWFAPRRHRYPAASEQGLDSLTVNTVLGAVCLVYLVYLVSQLAYFVGGFSGILPQGYTLAGYARRGFFEMAWLCAINLGLTALFLGISRKKPAPLSTRVLCMFISLITLVLVGTASAKMFLYIGAYGLTRLRVLTQVIMLFLALTTVVVIVWLFRQKLPYMKTVMLSALIIGALVIWTDVDTLVARYNVDAYLSGELKTVDVKYLTTLGNGAVPHIARLANEAEGTAADLARAHLETLSKQDQDLRSWNYVNSKAETYSLREEGEETQPSTERPLPADTVYDAFLRDVHLEAIHIAKDHVCIRGWEWGSDREVYCIALLDGTMYTPVNGRESLNALHSGEKLSSDGHDNWLPIIETEFVTDASHTGIRGRSIEQDITLWYLLDMENNQIFGPYKSEDEYWKACYEHKVYPMGKWEEMKT